MPDLGKDWSINEEGLKHALMFGYHIFVDDEEFIISQCNFRINLLNPLETRGFTHGIIQKKNEEIPCELGLIFIKFLRPEMVILGADLHEYGPFKKDEIIALPFIHTRIFIQNGTAIIYEE